MHARRGANNHIRYHNAAHFSTTFTHRFGLLVLEDTLALIHGAADKLPWARQAAPRHARARQLKPGVHGGLQQSRLLVAGDLVNSALPLDLHLTNQIRPDPTRARNTTAGELQNITRYLDLKIPTSHFSMKRARIQFDVVLGSSRG